MTHRDTSHLLVTSLVSSAADKGKPARYTLNELPPGRAKALASSRSLPDISSPKDSSPNYYGSEPFKVPLSTGPLTFDPDTKKLHHRPLHQDAAAVSLVNSATPRHRAG